MGVSDVSPVAASTRPLAEVRAASLPPVLTTGEAPRLKEALLAVPDDLGFVSGRRPLPTGDAVRAEAAASVNAHRALPLRDALEQLELPTDVARALILGVARPRTSSLQGQSGVLKAPQARRAARVFLALPAPERARVEALLRDALVPRGPEADPISEQALVLKALAVRAGGGPSALDELTRFAKAIRGVPRYALLHCTTLVDIDAKRRTSQVHTAGLTEKKWAQLAPGTKRRDDADGLVQLYEPSCGPTSVQGVLAEHDPIYAWAVHTRGGVQGLDGTGLADRFQRTWIEHFGDAPKKRRGLHDYMRAAELSRKLVEDGALAPAQRLGFLRFCRSAAHALTPNADTAIQRLRAAFGFPSDAELERMRTSAPTGRTLGTDVQQFSGMHDAVLTPVTGRGSVFVDRAARGVRKADIPRLGALLEEVPGVVVGTSDHWWYMTDARRGPDGWVFVLHDPLTGITAPVPEASLLAGDFPRTIFGWPKGDYLDSWFAPAG